MTMRTVTSLLLGALVFQTQWVWAGDAYDEVNEARRAAGMTAFHHNDNLAKAAGLHARYLVTNKLSGHGQRKGDVGFTGSGPMERALAAGYRSRRVSENVAQGQATSTEALDGLMAAIYHRFGFLDPEVDLLGIGTAGRGELRTYVYDMGNAALSRLCYGRPFEDYGRYYYGVCEPDIRIWVEDFDGQLEESAAQNPAYVLWPLPKASDIPPAFFEENPDPVPDLEVSGYPISLNVNEHKVEQVSVHAFHLFNVETGREVPNIRQLDQATDPNHKFTEYQYAWFPEQRLNWNTQYRAELSMTLDDKPVTRVWTFRTRALDEPFYTIRGQGETLKAARNGYVTVYIPPDGRFSEMGQIRYRYPQGVTVKTDFIDRNTLKVRVKGEPGSEVKFTTGSGHRFTVIVHGW